MFSSQYPTKEVQTLEISKIFPFLGPICLIEYPIANPVPGSTNPIESVSDPRPDLTRIRIRNTVRNCRKI
jgi:hypothetical protein